MYYVYILKSELTDNYYTGQTNNLNGRLKLHNTGKVKSTSRLKSWKLVYCEICDSREESLRREKYLKSHTGRNWIKKLFKGR